MPGHVPARAHGAQRGRGPRPCAAREGTAVSRQVDGTRPGESPAGRRPGSAVVLPREPRRSARGRRPDGRPIESEQQVLEEVHLQDLLGAQTVLLGDGAHLAAQARIVTDPGHPHITSR
ncbi:hypothetical protein ADJ70_11405 [Olsenella sp. oral taxon 807]|nr:hypothetical protein ADJ70_11405 [Olsenella sp. oral taxon 807]